MSLCRKCEPGLIEDYQYIMSKDKAFESLLSQNYSLFILTIECIGVSIYHTDSGNYQIFHSHAKAVVEANLYVYVYY